MGNVNFSADMVGIQTLAQQGTVAASDSVLAMGGSFEDMILQMIANNLTVDPTVDVEQILGGDTEEEQKTPQDIISDALMCNIINPELMAQIVPVQVNTEVQNVFEAVDGIQMQVAVQPGQNVKAEVVLHNVQANETVENADFIEVVHNEISAVKVEDASMIVDESADIDETSFVKDLQVQVDTEQKPEMTVKTEFLSDSKTETSTSEKSETFISTEDMLQLRMGNKIDFSDNKVMFKVADAPVNIESPTAVQDLADKILMKFNEEEFEVELFPKSLGKISISLALEDGIVRVVMGSTNDKVNEFLASQSANIQNIVEKNTQYQAVVKVDESNEQYQQQQRENAQQGAPEQQKQRQQEHMQHMYRQNVQHTDDFLSMLKLV